MSENVAKHSEFVWTIEKRYTKVLYFYYLTVLCPETDVELVLHVKYVN